MFAQKLFADGRKRRIVHHGKIGGKIHSPQRKLAVQGARKSQNFAVAFGRGAYDHLRGLPRGQVQGALCRAEYRCRRFALRVLQPRSREQTGLFVLLRPDQPPPGSKRLFALRQLPHGQKQRFFCFLRGESF